METFSVSNQHLIEALATELDRFSTSIEHRSVASKSLSLTKQPLPDNGVNFDGLCQRIGDSILPNLSASNGGRYWGFVTGGANPFAIYADWLVSLYDQNVSKGGDSIATAVEHQALSWLRDLFALPDVFSGIFTTGATSANLLAAFTARQFAGHQQSINVALEGMQSLQVKILSATPHASMIKSLGMAGFGQNNWQAIPCLSDSEAMDVDQLRLTLEVCAATTPIVIASAGTVTGTDFDDLQAIAELCDEHGAWLHVDAAFGIFERLVNPQSPLTKGLELADSITLDCHKWLNVPYDCGVFLTRHQRLLQQCCEVNAPYFANDDDVPFMFLGIENSRRFRAFPVWSTLLAYGRAGITQQIENNLSQARQLANWLERSAQYELVKPCQLNVVLFRPTKTLTGLSAKACMDKINDSGEIFVTPGVWQGEPIIRAAISNWATTNADIERVIKLLRSTIL